MGIAFIQKMGGGDASEESASQERESGEGRAPGDYSPLQHW
jgi:hypothetical protein